MSGFYKFSYQGHEIPNKFFIHKSKLISEKENISLMDNFVAGLYDKIALI